MFGRRLAYAFLGCEGEPWESRWHRHHRGRHRGRGHAPRFFGWHFRRDRFGRGGLFGPGGLFGDEGFFGPPGPGKRFFMRGDLKYALLELLQERPMHGYELMKTLQERTRGMYSASPGSVYPTLQMLEDRDFVTASEAEGKKVYSITDAGRAYLAEGRPEAWRGSGRPGFWAEAEEEWPEPAALWQELRQTGPLLARALHRARHDPETVRRLKHLLERVRSELAEIAGESERYI